MNSEMCFWYDEKGGGFGFAASAVLYLIVQ